MKPKDILIDPQTLRHFFEVRDGELVWKNRTDSQARINGKVAGGIHPDGYRRIKFNEIAYPAHRLMWIYFNGEISSELQIDHIDGNKLNNHIENLRLVSAQENCFNRSRHKAKGYTWHKQMRKWQASIFVNGGLKHLGLFASENDARNAYLKAVKTERPNFAETYV